MSVRIASLAAGAALIALSGVASAAELSPGQIEKVDLDGQTGVVFYRAEPEGYRLFAGIQPNEEGQAVRFEAVLGQGQRLRFVAPSIEGRVQQSFVVSRVGDKVLLEGPISN